MAQKTPKKALERHAKNDTENAIVKNILLTLHKLENVVKLLKVLTEKFC